MKIHFILPILFLAIMSCKPSTDSNEQDSTESTTEAESTVTFDNKGHELVYNMVQKVGDYNKFLEKKDVVYTYTYATPDGKTDISTEKYIFDGELSYGAYSRHERTSPELEGLIEQGYDGNEYWFKNKGEDVTDEKTLGSVAFKRPTNFYWFAMMPKLLDPNLIYEYVEEKTIGDATYDVVKVTFESPDGKPKDIYQVYINRKTNLVDQFLFTVMDFGRAEPLLMKVEYEDIGGLLIPSKRMYKGSNWDAEETDDPWINVNWTDIKFDNGLTIADFKK